ncbi:MAG: hypothetical protein ACRDY7_02830 [Acidimicrobiia bacterium]
MALAWSREWHDQHMKQCREDKEFQDEAEGYDRTVTIHVIADPGNGVEKDNWHGFNPPQMTEVWWGEENRPATPSDYIIEGSYRDWWAVNEGKKGLVASLLDQSIKLTAGNTSYIAMFVPAVERFYVLSRNITDSYEGDYKPRER